MPVLYDHRETKSTIPTLLALEGVELEARQLPVGDYIISDRLAVERKAANDLVQSIKDGRLFEQASRLSEAYPISILMLEGGPQFPREGWRGALGSVIRRGVTVLRTSDVEESAEWIARLARQEVKGATAPRGSGRKQRDPDAQAEAMLATLPGISVTAARRLLGHFGSLQAVMTAEPKELQTVEGIGRKRSLQLADIFRRPYDDKPF